MFYVRLTFENDDAAHVHTYEYAFSSRFMFMQMCNFVEFLQMDIKHLSELKQLAASHFFMLQNL